MPLSIVSTTSAWCSASRAAQLIASEGVCKAEGSRWRGRVEPAGKGGEGSSLSTKCAIGPVKPRNSNARMTLNARWNAITCAWMLVVWLSSSAWICGKNGIVNAQPASLNSRLPSGKRRRTVGGPELVNIERMPLPKLAPSTRPSAPSTGRMPDAASVAVSNTNAKLE